ncbi:unnamed protein product [Parnassius mnemosyne]|uniref:Venom serine protease 34 n=1 Tax=Parnassius mnemosyne TaxID=213953 RepID=A0AAV1L8E0_9NEOP
MDTVFLAFMKMKLIAIGLSLALLGSGRAQNPNCDFTQNVRPNQVYYVYSPNYPNNYSAGVQCRWIMVCPTGYNCQLDCSEINLPESPSCSMDRLLVSRDGDPQLASAEYYCGRGTLNVTSNERRLSLGLISSYQSPGGRFYCELRATPAIIRPRCRCGYKKLNRIVGGQETGVNEFPMMAGVIYVDLRRINCGAVIISKRRVMSAAHCVIRKTTRELGVVVGEHNVNVADSPATEVFRVININIHPQYTEANYDYDVSILTVEREIVFSDRVGPVCLPFKFLTNDFTGAKVTVLGWGTLFPGGPTSAVLRKVDVDVISQPACRRSVPSVTPRQMCTYTPGKDSCQDDSGGPLLYTDPSNGLLYSVGIVSFGSFCASGEPAVNARVTTLLRWIVSVANDDYCRI